jgi:NADPH:quinone reductase-like Zn-dependent oxidoreductase
MRAVIAERYGPPDVLHVGEVPTPEPGRGEIRIRVRAASVNPLDWKIRKGSLRLVLPQRFPMVLGFDVAGEVDAVGAGVHGFAVGEGVYSRLASRSGGGYAEFAVTKATAVAPMPRGISFTDAASLPLVALTALQGLLMTGRVSAGHSVLINGASGGVGTAAVQIARALGAEVTGVCSAKNKELVLGLGAQHVVDYASKDFTTGTARYDMIMDVQSNRSYGECRRVLAPDGLYLRLLPSPGTILWSIVTLFTRRRIAIMSMKPSGQDLRYITELVERGELKAIVDRVFPLEEAAAAHAASEAGHLRGKVVLSLEGTA